MSRKDYVAIAAAVSAQYDRPNPRHADYRNALDRVTLALADTFARDNPRFDKSRFLRACWSAKGVAHNA